MTCLLLCSVNRTWYVPAVSAENADVEPWSTVLMLGDAESREAPGAVT